MANNRFPEFYMITGKFNGQVDFENKLMTALEQGQKVVQFRSKTIDDPQDYLSLVKSAQLICKNYGVQLLLATSPELFNQTDAAGLHLNSQALFEYESRPVAEDKLLSVSCHDLEDMQYAVKLGADMLLLSPVKATASHPDMPGMGWERFKEMTAEVKCPVYALGGMKDTDLDDAKEAGARGIAATLSLWE